MGSCLYTGSFPENTLTTAVREVWLWTDEEVIAEGMYFLCLRKHQKQIFCIYSISIIDYFYWSVINRRVFGETADLENKNP